MNNGEKFEAWWLLTRNAIVSVYIYVQLILGAIIAGLSIWLEMEDFLKDYRPDPWGFFWLYMGVGILFGGLQILKHRSFREIEKQLAREKTNHRQELTGVIRYYGDMLREDRTTALNDTLQEFCEELEFTSSERICVYRYVEDGNYFICVGRYSEHFQYTKIYNNKNYPGNSGIIGKVWHEPIDGGYFRDDQFPNPDEEHAQFIEYVSGTYQIDQNTIEAFRMKAVDIFAELIRDVKRKQVAVIVFESKQENKIDSDRIRDLYRSKYKARIVDSIERLQAIPNTVNLNGEERVDG